MLVLIDPDRARAHGYLFDGVADGLLRYTGEGRDGDQILREGNRAIAEHVADGRALRVFTAEGTVAGTPQKMHRYLGEFRVDPHHPFSTEDARDGRGEMRIVFVFTLHPVRACRHQQWGQGQAPLPSETTTVQSVPLETDTTLTFTTAATVPTRAAKREAALVAAYRRWHGPAGADLTRFAIRPTRQSATRVTDVFDPATATLFEAKGQRHDAPDGDPHRDRPTPRLPSSPAAHTGPARGSSPAAVSRRPLRPHR